MKKTMLIILLLLALYSDKMWAQSYIITEVTLRENDLSARVYPRNDRNGELCSVLKISSPNAIKSVEGFVVGKVEKNSTHTLAYIPKDTKSVRIVYADGRNEELCFRDWGIDAISAGSSYEIKLTDIGDLDEEVLLQKGRAYYKEGLYKQALQFFHKCVEVSSNEDYRILSLLMIADYYRKVEKKYPKSYEILDILSDDAIKYTMIGVLKCEEKMIKDAIDNFKKAEQKGSKEAVLALLRIYKGEIKSEFEDKNQAFTYGIKVAATGNVDAQHFVACCYLGGLGVNADIDAGIEYLTMAATQGKVESQRMLGAIYVMDNKRDIPKARRWLKMAASQNDKEAKELLDEIGWE